MQLSRRWTIAGLLLAIGGFFLHPETCIHSVDILSKIVPLQDQGLISHISMVLGGLITALGTSIIKETAK